MSSFVTKKLDYLATDRHAPTMARKSHPSARGSSDRVAAIVRSRVEAGGERLWRYDDFRDLPFAAVARALSRLCSLGEIERLSKGTYFRSRPTSFGRSRPSPSAVRELARGRSSMFPAGVAAANLLGLSSQSSGRGELATSAGSLPRKLVGADTIVHVRRPAGWRDLSQIEAAILDVLRRSAKPSDLAPEETVERLLTLLRERGTLGRLLKVAMEEPPRVRAMLGSLAEHLGKPRRALASLRASLNPASRFEFGPLARLPNAHAWQAKERNR